MHFSVVDLDTYMRDYQTERQREADLARRIDEAVRTRIDTPDPLALGLAQLVRRTRTWLSYLVAGKDVTVGCPQTTPDLMNDAAEPVAPAARWPSAEPYSDMVVVARGVRETAARQ